MISTNKKLFVLSLSAGIGMLMQSCTPEKEIPTMLNGYFYTTDSSSSENPFYLYIDGSKKGVLPYIANKEKYMPLPTTDSNLRSQALQIDFMSGEHLIESRTSDGSIVAASTMSFRFYKNSSKGSTESKLGGGGSMQSDKDKSVSIYVAGDLK